MRVIRLRHIITGLLLTTTLFAAFLIPATAADPPAEKDAATYINEQFAAYEELARVRALVGRREWERAAEGYDRLIERYGDCLIKSSRPASTSPQDEIIESFVALAAVVIDEMARGPEPLLSAYLKRFDPMARQALARPTTRPSDTNRIANRYFHTRPAAEVLEQFADRLVEAADFHSAARLYAQLATLHTDRATRGEVWRTKRAMCLAWLGDRGDAEHLLASSQPFEDEEVKWAGRTQSSRAFLRALLSSLSTQPGHPMDFVTSGRAASILSTPPTVTSILPEARLWQFRAFAPLANPTPGEADSSSEVEESRRRALQSGSQLNMMPVAIGNMFIISDRRHVWAVDPANVERAAWRYDLEPDTAEPGERVWSAQEEPPPLHSLSLSGDRVYAHLDRTEPENADPPQGGASTLICLDARSGSLFWRRDVNILGGPFDECRLDGAPLIMDDKLIVVARRRKPFGFEACILAAFDARSGSLLWQTHLGEAATGGYGFHRPTRTFPAASGSRVFVHTNIGTIAAIDADNGRIAWLERYPSSHGQSGDSWQGRGAGEAHPWLYSPTFTWRDCAVIAPMDFQDVLVMRQEDGRIVQRIAPAAIRGAETLIGIRGDHLFAVGGWVVCYDLAARRVAWERQLPTGRLLGRGALTDDAVFVPTDAALLRYPIAGGSPASHIWTTATCGNVLPQMDQVVVAGDRLLTALVQKDAAFRNLDERLAADKDAAEPAMALAELAFETSEFERGLAAIDEAVRRAHQSERRLDSPLKSRIFRICMKQVDLMNNAAMERPDATAPSIVQALALLDRAAACAPDADGEVRYRLKRAEILTVAGQFSAAATVCQQILADPGLAIRIVEVDGRRMVAGGPAAQRQIARLIDEHGRGIYSEVEKAAADRLRIASASGDIGALRLVSQRYPNSMAAGKALAQRAALLHKQGENLEAARDLRRALQIADATDAPLLRQTLAELLVRSGNNPAARDILATAARRHPATRFKVSGRSLSFAEWQRALADTTDIDSGLPAFTLPLSRRFSREFPSGATLLTPSLVRPGDSSPREFLVWSDDEVQCHSSATGKPIWPQPFKVAVKPTLLYSEERTAVLSTPQQTMGVDLDRGVLVWSIGSSPADAALPGMDPERLSHFTAHTRTPGRYFGANDRGELTCIGTQSGRTEWRIGTEPRIGTRVIADDRWLVYSSWQDRRNVLVIVDAAGGRVVHQIALSAERPVQRLQFTDDGLLVAISTTTLHGIDPDAGRVLWSTPLDGPASMTSVALTSDGLYLSTDNNTLARFELLTGAPRGSTPPLGAAGNDSLHSLHINDRIYVAAQTAFSAIDAATGTSDWESGGLRVIELLSPALVGGDLLAVTDTPAHRTDAAARFSLICIDGATGIPRIIASASTQPASSTALSLERVDGILLCRDAVVVVSGKVVTGFGGAAVRGGGSR